MLDKVAVIGAGSWGTTVAAIASLSAPTLLWARRSTLGDAIDQRHENPDYLPGIALPDRLRATSSLEQAVDGASLVIMAVPSHGFRSVLTDLAPHVAPHVPLLSLAKGLEQGTHLRMTELVAQILPDHPTGVLTGPNLAREVVAGQPAATVVAMTDEASAREVQELLRTESFRVYTNPDLVGCETAGATKNVLAIAAGIIQGLGLGDSSLAALITRGLAELGRFGVAMGGDPMTMAGLAGVGDLVATCTSRLSRNRTVGELLGQGRTLDEVLADMRMVAEGVKSARPLLELAALHGVEMPIGQQVADILAGIRSPAEAIPALMLRSAKSEFHGLDAASPIDMTDSQAAALARVRAFLVEHRVPEETIARAEKEDVLDLLVVDCTLVPGERYTQDELTEITGMPVELASRFWRALGFADASADDKIFTDLDIEAIGVLQTMIDLGAADIDTALQLARVIGSSMARIAEAEVAPAVRGVIGAPEPGAESSVEAADRFVRLADRSLPAMTRLLEFAWRRHVQASVRRAMLLRSRHVPGALPELCVGFADMVGFTMLSQQLSEEELAALVSRFEDVAHDTVTARGGRVVKMIGDEVMFVTDTATDAARIALALAEAYADDELLSDVRVALAVGPVLVQDGDFYGPVVNLASRAADIAAPGSVLVSDEFHSTLLAETHASAGEFAFKALRPRLVKDLGRVQLWALYRPGSEPMTLDRRANRRWERLSDVLHELDDLRERGERLLSGGARTDPSASTEDT